MEYRVDGVPTNVLDNDNGPLSILGTCMNIQIQLLYLNLLTLIEGDFQKVLIFFHLSIGSGNGIGYLSVMNEKR